MAKRSIFSRIAQLFRSNVNSALDKAEDPEKMMEQMVHDFNEKIREAENSAAQTIGNLRMLEQDYHEHLEASSEWGHKAASAVNRSEEYQRLGDTGNAEKFNGLAKIALQRQMNAEKSAKNLEATIASQKQSIEILKKGVHQLKTKRDELVNKRDELVARKRSAETQSLVHDMMQQFDAADPTAELSRYEESIRSVEARVRGYQELEASSLENQFAELESASDNVEIEARLVALKHGGYGDNNPRLTQ